jgi:hypothetical protein
MKNAIAAIPSAPRTAPTPIPAFAPVLRLSEDAGEVGPGRPGTEPGDAVAEEGGPPRVGFAVNLILSFEASAEAYAGSKLDRSEAFQKTPIGSTMNDA